MMNSNFAKFIEESNTWFELVTDEESPVVFETDFNGSLARSEPSQLDYREGQRLLSLLEREFPDWNWEINVVDQFVKIRGEDGEDLKVSSLSIGSGDPVHVKVAKRTYAKQAGISTSRVKTAGEIRFVKDQGPEQREIPKDFKFDNKYIKPMSRVVWGLSVAMGHLDSSHSKFTKIKAVNISPDGRLGGKGYIQPIKDMRRDLSEAIETVSELIDTIHDELRADHWKEGMADLSDEDREEVDDIIDESEDIISDPDFADEEFEEDGFSEE